MATIFMVNGGVKEILSSTSSVLNNTTSDYVADALVIKEFYNTLNTNITNLENQIVSTTNTFSYSTVSDMVSATELITGQIAITSGYYSENDGGGQVYHIGSTAKSFSITLSNGLYANPEINTVANIKKYGAKTSSNISTIISNLFSLSTVDTVFIPVGDWTINATIYSNPRYFAVKIPDNKTLMGEGFKTNLILNCTASSSTKQCGIYVGSFSTLKNLSITIDSTSITNKTIQEYGILSYEEDHPYLEGVKVYKFNSIGVGLVGCNYARLINCDISECGNSKCGIWDANSSSSTENQGHTVIDGTRCCKNQLDGIIFSSNYITITNSVFCENGYGGSYGDAYGAGGIFSSDNRSAICPTITNCCCRDNSEYGINLASWIGIVSNNDCGSNDIGGILIKSPTNEVTVTGNICNDNGVDMSGTTLSTFGANRNGITIDGGCGNVLVTGNICGYNKINGISIPSGSVSGLVVANNIGTTNNIPNS